MKTKLTILLTVLIGAGALLVSPPAEAQHFTISVGDKAYYHGRRDFWDYGWHWVWVPGHWRHGRWIHGYYVREGNWNARYVRERYPWHNYRY